MKKKLLIGTILPSIAALAVIGSGFSLWIFNDSSSVETTGSVGINVTKVLDITNSTIRVINTESNLIFNQSKSDLNPKGDGLRWALNNEYYSTSWLIGVFMIGDPTGDNATAYDDSVNYTFTTTITLSKVLASYVKLTFDKSLAVDQNNWINGDWTDGVVNADDNDSVTYKYTFDSKNTLQISEKSDLGFQTIFSFALVTPTYQTGMEPTTLGTSDETEHSYLKMLKDVKGESISVTYEVKATIEA